MDFQCLSQKNEQYILQECERLAAEDEHVAFYKSPYSNSEEDIMDFMEDRGVSVISVYREYSQEPEITDEKDFEDLENSERQWRSIKTSWKNPKRYSGNSRLTGSQKAVKVIYINGNKPELTLGPKWVEEEKLTEDRWRSSKSR